MERSYKTIEAKMFGPEIFILSTKISVRTATGWAEKLSVTLGGNKKNQ